MKFYLGVPRPSNVAMLRVPVFLSVMALISARQRPPLGPPYDVQLDSGGFTELSRHGQYTIEVGRYLQYIIDTNVPVAYCQDWMCEPEVIKRTGLSVEEHQRRTIDSYLFMSKIAKATCPVLQGWHPQEYVNHVQQYTAAGVDLRACKSIGVGTLCRRTSTPLIHEILRAIHATGLVGNNLHGFGLKTNALQFKRITTLLASADSMAWCMSASRFPLKCCEGSRCSNCLVYALNWRHAIIMNLATIDQPELKQGPFTCEPSKT